MGVKAKIGKTVTLQLISADPSEVLLALNKQGITVMNLVWDDPLTVRFSAHFTHLKQIRRISDRYAGRVTQIGKTGQELWISVIKRPVLTAGMLLFLFLTFFLPSRVLFVNVEGCIAVPVRKVLDVAQRYGVGFGASRHTLRSERIKNALLTEIPELQWAGVNTRGCVAEIRVKERLEEEQPDTYSGITSIIASQDGVILDITLVRGTPACQKGQAVKAGQLLVSGYSDCGICIHGTRAEAEIKALTHRTLTVKTLPLKGKWVANGVSEQKISLLIGKKRINFSQDSGIHDTTCGKMYVEYYLTLPGGFRLPLGIAFETCYGRELLADAQDEEKTAFLLEGFAKRYLVEQMIAGMIGHSQVAVDCSLPAPQLNGYFICTEMIGRTRNEETIEHYE